MARKSRTRLHLPTVAHKRSSYEQRSGAGTRGASLLFRAFSEGAQFLANEDGDLVRQWPAARAISSRTRTTTCAGR